MRQTPQEETKDSQPKTANEEKPEIKAEDLVYTPLDNPGLDTSSWKTFRSQEYGLEFKYPKDWEVSVATHVSQGNSEYFDYISIAVFPKDKEMGEGTGYEIYLTKKSSIRNPEVISVIRGKITTLKSLVFPEGKHRIFSPIQIQDKRILVYDRDQNYDPAYENTGGFVSLETVFLDTNTRYFAYLHGQSSGLNNELTKKIIYQTLFSLKFFE